jgi:predicted peptidase
MRSVLVLLSFITALLISCRKDKGTVQVFPPVINPIDTVPATPGQSPQQVYNQVAVLREINKNVGGYYEALPHSYQQVTTERYPLLIFLHGGGELGNGKSDLPLILKNSLTKRLHEKTLPVKFSVGGRDFSFIILSPQFKKWPKDEDVDAVIEFALSNYRVDTSRIYLSGLSMGGGATWEYAGSIYGKKLAAIVPICGASWADSAVARGIARNEIPSWAFHNTGDLVVKVNSTKRYERFINNENPKYPPKVTLWETDGHDAWTRASDPEYREEGKNMYEWMLQFTR